MAAWPDQNGIYSIRHNQTKRNQMEFDRKLPSQPKFTTFDTTSLGPLNDTELTTLAHEVMADLRHLSTKSNVDSTDIFIRNLAEDYYNDGDVATSPISTITSASPYVNPLYPSTMHPPPNHGTKKEAAPHLMPPNISNNTYSKHDTTKSMFGKRNSIRHSVSPIPDFTQTSSDLDIGTKYKQKKGNGNGRKIRASSQNICDKYNKKRQRNKKRKRRASNPNQGLEQCEYAVETKYGFYFVNNKRGVASPGDKD